MERNEKMPFKLIRFLIIILMGCLGLDKIRDNITETVSFNQWRSYVLTFMRK
jgi:hypothetical protein